MTKARWIVVAAGAVAGAIALIALARAASDAAPTSDTAVIESYTLLASQGSLSLGTYSRFQWHHPGPLYFYWMAPFYVLSGFRTTGLNAGALALNLTSLAIIAAVVRRRSDTVLAVPLVGALALYVWRAAEVLTSPWSPHVTVVTMMALVVTAADVVSGSVFMLPVAAAFACLVGQTYVGLLPSAVAIGAVMLPGAALFGTASDGSRAGALGRMALTSSVVVLVFWLPPLREEFTSRPGNLTQLWTYFVTASHPGQAFREAVSAWSDMLSGIVRPDFYVAHGWLLHESPVRWAEGLVLVQGAGLLVSGTLALRARRGFELALASLLALTSLFALWSATRIEEAIYDHSVFWMSGLGVLNMAILVSLIARLVVNRARLSVPASSGMACWALVAVGVVVGAQQLREAVRHSRDPGAESTTVTAVANDLRTYLADRKIARPLIRIDQDAWGSAAGVILQLQKAGVPVAVEDDWMAMFTPVFAADGREGAAFMVAGKAEHVRLLDVPGDTVVVSHDPIYVHLALRPQDQK